MTIKTKHTTPREITLRIRRYNPEQDSAPRWEEHRLPVKEGMTVLEALHAIKGERDATLAWRSSCRMGVCGSCGMYINGLPRLACQTQVLHLEAEVVTIAPLPNYPNVKDLVPDLQPLFERHQAVKPYMVPAIASESGSPTGEYLQLPHQREAYSQFTICIKCGLCLAACPTVATDPLFLGPQALAQAFRYTVDNRDCGLVERLVTLDAFHGPYQCHLAGACTDACPKGVDPALGVQLLKRTLVLHRLGLRRKKSSVKVMPLALEVVPSEKYTPPPRTVK